MFWVGQWYDCLTHCMMIGCMYIQGVYLVSISIWQINMQVFWQWCSFKKTLTCILCNHSWCQEKRLTSFLKGWSSIYLSCILRCYRLIHSLNASFRSVQALGPLLWSAPDSYWYSIYISCIYFFEWNITSETLYRFSTLIQSLPVIIQETQATK